MCVPCRIATRSCGAFHRAKWVPSLAQGFNLTAPGDALTATDGDLIGDMRDDLGQLSYDIEKERLQAYRERKWTVMRRLAKERALVEEALKYLTYNATSLRCWNEQQVGTERISDDPEFVRRLLEMRE